MEELEEELLSRLKNSQQLEQNEHGKLEDAIKASHDACEERRKKQSHIRKPRPNEIAKMRSSISTLPSEKNQNGQHL
jgi:hypothetical protein